MAWGNLCFLIPLPSTLPIPLSSYQFHFLSSPPLPVPFSFLFMWVFETCQRQSPTPSGHLFRVELFQKPWVNCFFPWSLPSFPLVFICLRIPRKLWIWHRCSTVKMNYTLTVKGGSRLNIYIYIPDTVPNADILAGKDILLNSPLAIIIFILTWAPYPFCQSSYSQVLLFFVFILSVYKILILTLPVLLG